VCPALRHQIADPTGQYARLAGTGARHYEDGTALMQHRLALWRVESFQQLLDGQSCRSRLRRTRHGRSPLGQELASTPQSFLITQPTLDVSKDTMFDRLAAPVRLAPA
jgi:hypothetical protein